MVGMYWWKEVVFVMALLSNIFHVGSVFAFWYPFFQISKFDRHGENANRVSMSCTILTLLTVTTHLVSAACCSSLIRFPSMRPPISFRLIHLTSFQRFNPWCLPLHSLTQAASVVTLAATLPSVPFPDQHTRLLLPPSLMPDAPLLASCCYSRHTSSPLASGTFSDLHSRLPPFSLPLLKFSKIFQSLAPCPRNWDDTWKNK